MQKNFKGKISALFVGMAIFISACSSAPPKKIAAEPQQNREPDSLLINQLQFFDFQVQYDGEQHALTIDWTVSNELKEGSFEILYGKYCASCRIQEDVKVIGSISATGKRGTERGLPAYRFTSYDKLKGGDSVFQLRYNDGDGVVNSSYKVLHVQ